MDALGPLTKVSGCLQSETKGVRHNCLKTLGKVKDILRFKELLLPR